MSAKSITELVSKTSCQDDYDPNAMPVAQAKKYIRDYLVPVTETEQVSLHAALGRVLAENIISNANVPNHDNSAMDGYAFNADSIVAEGETTLTIIGTAFAGNSFAGTVEKGQCIRIMTGAVIPKGVDTVIPQERVEVLDQLIKFGTPIKRGMNVRYAGEDLRIGQTVLSTGHVLKPADLGLVASLGIGKVSVYRKLKVAFFSTGDELASIGSNLKTGQVYDSNRYTIFGMLSRLGVELIDMGVTGDDPVLLENTLLQAAQSADVVITSGGVSVGAADYMKELLAKQGQVVFWKIAMKPGRPLAYGKVGNAHYFGLPGNPVAVMVTFYQFVREALLTLMGQPTPTPLPLIPVTCSEEIRKLKGRTEFQRGILFTDADGTWKVKPTGNQGSGILSSMSAANCFIVLSEEVGNLAAGSKVDIQLLEGLI
jgi:molybdopterin molybdotransferase